MAMPVVIAKNQTGSDIDLDRLGQRVPASGQKTLTEDASYTECTEDESLEAAVASGDIVLNDGTADLSVAEGLVYLNSAGNLDGPATGAVANVLLRLSDGTGTKTEATGVTVDASDNITTTGTVNAAAVEVGGSPLGIDDLDDVDTSTVAPTANDGLRWDGSADWVPLKNNHTTTDPAVTDDSASNYTVGSRWINTSTGAEYVLLDASVGAAVWHITTAVGGSGASLGGEWRFDTSTAAGNPGSGKFRLNNATQASSTALYISETNSNNVDFANIISSLKPGDTVYMQEERDATRFVLVTVTAAPTDNGSWQTVPISVDAAGPNDLRNNNKCGVVFLSTGIPEHSTLGGLGWTVSGHTGTASRIAAFSGGGAAAYLQVGVDVQAWDTDLDALAGLGSTGIIVRNGAGSATTRSLVAPAAGFIINDADGVAGDPTFVLANDLAGLEGMTGTGFVSRTSTNNYAQRTITGTAGRITVTNGDGIGGNPTLDVGANVILTTTTLGGDLSGNLPNAEVTDLTITDEETGSILYFDGFNWVQLPPGTVNQVLQTLGAGTVPVWYTIPAAAYADYYNSAAHNITTTAATVALNSTRQSNAAFTLSGNEVTINTGGDYRVDFDLALDDTSTQDRTVEVWYELNGSEIVGTRSKCLHDAANEEGALHVMAILTLAASDVVRVRAQSNTANVDTLADGVRFMLHSIGGNGAQGPAGAGSAIIVQDEGVTVPGGPHSTLDFAGAGVTATNVGSGKALITVTGGGGGATSINDLTDVDTATQAPTANDLFVWDGVGDWVPLKNNQTSTDPTVSNDNTEDYVVGSQWINTTDDSVWICVDNSTGAAVWLPMAGAGASNQYFDAYDLSGGTDVTSGWTDVPLNTERQKDALYTHTNPAATVTVGATDLYLVFARVTTDQSVGNSRCESEMRIAVNGSAVAGTNAALYNRNTTQSRSTGTVVAVLSLSASDTVKAQAQRLSGAGTILLSAEGSSLTLVRIGVGGASVGGGGGGSITVEDEGSSVVGVATTLNFVGAGVTATSGGGGEAVITVPGPVFDSERHVFYADQLESPTNANWAVNALAPAQADSVNAALTVRAFDDTTEEGVGASMSIPDGATSITFKFAGRASTAPGAAAVVGLNLYRRTISDNAAVTAWSAALGLTDLDIPTNANFQYDEQTVTLATLGLTAGDWVQFELTRNPTPGSGTDLVGDWLMLSVILEFI